MNETYIIVSGALFLCIMIIIDGLLDKRALRNKKNKKKRQ